MAKLVSDFQIVTANRLRDGEVVFLAPDLSWTENVVEACVASDKESSESLLSQAQKSIANNFVIDAYLVPVRVEGRTIEPLHHREKIRTLGPSVRKDLGKQAANANADIAHDLSLAS